MEVEDQERPYSDVVLTISARFTHDFNNSEIVDAAKFRRKTKNDCYPEI